MLVLKRTSAALFASLILASALPALSSASGAVCPGADEQPRAATIARARAATLCLMNAERAERGLRALKQNSRLYRASRRYAARMVQRRFFDHVGPRGDTVVERLRSIGYLPRSVQWTVGENLAWGGQSLGTPREIVRAWMESPGHRRNILARPFREVGIGIALGSPVGGRTDAAATYTAAFGAVRRRRR
jgi:uncharacterized protein YkwD